MTIQSRLARVALVCCGLQLAAFANAAQQDRSLDQMLPEYSRCIVAIMPQDAIAFVVSAQTLEGGASPKPKRPTNDRCSYAFAGNEEVRFIASWYRDELAVPLVKRDFATRGPVSFENKGSLIHPDAPAAGASRYAYRKMEYNNSRLGECVARSAPEAVRSWIISSVDAEGDPPSAAVDNARRACSRALSAAFMGDRTRGPIARGYYRLAHAPSIDGAPK